MTNYTGYIFKPLHLQTILQVKPSLARNWLIAKHGDSMGREMAEMLEDLYVTVTEGNIHQRLEELGLETLGGKVLYVRAYGIDTKHTMPPSILI